VGPEEIAGVVARWTGIPVSRLQQTERQKLLQLKEQLHERVVRCAAGALRRVACAPARLRLRSRR
jgi:ATP-dependent Clp protease ATP-binding subunit ClpB